MLSVLWVSGYRKKAILGSSALVSTWSNLIKIFTPLGVTPGNKTTNEKIAQDGDIEWITPQHADELDRQNARLEQTIDEAAQNGDVEILTTIISEYGKNHTQIEMILLNETLIDLGIAYNQINVVKAFCHRINTEHDHTKNNLQDNISSWIKAAQVSGKENIARYFQELAKQQAVQPEKTIIQAAQNYQAEMSETTIAR